MFLMKAWLVLRGTNAILIEFAIQLDILIGMIGFADKCLARHVILTEMTFNGKYSPSADNKPERQQNGHANRT